MCCDPYVTLGADQINGGRFYRIRRVYCSGPWWNDHRDRLGFPGRFHYQIYSPCSSHRAHCSVYYELLRGIDQR